jgi:hypothetical protein
LARRFAGEPDAPVDSEIIWADPEIRTEGEVVDAAVKKYQAGLTPWYQTMEDIGYSQTKIAAMLDAFGGVAPTPAPVLAPTPTPSDTTAPTQASDLVRGNV